VGGGSKLARQVLSQSQVPDLPTSTVVLITLITYKLVLIGVGIWASRRNHDETDFFLGGRDLGPFVAGMSYAASTSSAWVILGFSGFVYGIGVGALWMVPGIWAGYAVVWLYFGRRLREESLTSKQITLTDFLLQDSNEEYAQAAGQIERKASEGSARALTAGVAALLTVVCFIFYIAAQFDAAGKALAEHFLISVPQAVIVGAVIGSTLCRFECGGGINCSVAESCEQHARKLFESLRRIQRACIDWLCVRFGRHVTGSPGSAAFTQPLDGDSGRGGAQDRFWYRH